MKKFFSFALILATLFVSMFAQVPNAKAATGNAFSLLSSSKYAKTYTLKSSGTTIPYTSKKLTTRGTTTYGASSSAYIDNASDELYVYSVGKTNGKAWAYVSYPTSSGRVKAYIDLNAVTAYSTSHITAVSKGKFYCSKRYNTSNSSSYYVDAGDRVYILGKTDSKYQILYPIANGKYRIAFCKKSDYNRYCTSDPVTSSLSWPCQSTYISTMYRYWNGGNPTAHKTRSNNYNAFDVQGNSGERIYAAGAGTVVEKGYKSDGFGHYIVIRLNSSGLYTLYGHLRSAALYNKGQSVSKGATIGYMGSTGNSSGTHLHFEMYDNSNKSRVIDPFATYYKNKVSVTIGGNSYKANNVYYNSDSRARAWCNWLKNSCTQKSNGDYVYVK